jgi:hypothetical protein
MKHIKLHCILGYFHQDLPSLSFSQSVSPRIIQNFDFDWKFILDDSIDASSKDFNDLKWENIQVPLDSLSKE